MTTTGNSRTPPRTAREYLRVSLDRSGRARSLDEQHTDNAAGAEREGWTLAAAYRDNSVSASRYSRKTRDGFAELMTDLAAGRFAADVLILWESSRGSRRVGEWVQLIEACAEHGVAIHVTTHGRSYDPRNGRDRRSLLEDAVDSEYESSKVSDRAKRATASSAAAGRPHGRVPYGYRRTYDPRTGRLDTQEPHPSEAPVVREMFARVLAGESLRAVAADLAARGVEKRSGGPFSPQHVRSLLLTPTYAGIRVHDPGRAGRGRQKAVAAGASTTRGAWPALIDDATYHGVHRLLTDPARRTSRPGRGVHLLSMIAECAGCGAALVAANRGPGGARQYQCRSRGCVRIDADGLDHIATLAMLAYLAREDVHAALTATEDDHHDLTAARDDVARVRAELDDLADAVGRGELSATLAARSEPAILARLRAAEGRVRELTTPSALRGLVGPGADVADRWVDAPMSARRDVARLLLSPEVLGALTVHRRPEGRRGGGAVVPVEQRVGWRRTDVTERDNDAGV